MLGSHLALAHQSSGVQLLRSSLQVLTDRLGVWSFHASALDCRRTAPPQRATPAYLGAGDLIHARLVILVLANVFERTAASTTVAVLLRLVREVIAEVSSDARLERQRRHLDRAISLDLLGWRSRHQRKQSGSAFQGSRGHPGSARRAGRHRCSARRPHCAQSTRIYHRSPLAGYSRPHCPRRENDLPPDRWYSRLSALRDEALLECPEGVPSSRVVSLAPMPRNQRRLLLLPRVRRLALLQNLLDPMVYFPQGFLAALCRPCVLHRGVCPDFRAVDKKCVPFDQPES